MAVRNFEIRKNGSGYTIAEQNASNYHTVKTSHDAPDREDAQAWLCAQGGAPDIVDQALTDLQSTEHVYVEMVGNYIESEDFPKL